MKRKIDLKSKITYFFYVLLAITLIWDYFFRTGEKLFRIILIYGTIFLARFLFNKTFLKRSKVAYYITIGFIFFAMYLANVMNFYAIPYYDKMLHLSSGVLLGYIGLILYTYCFGSLDNKNNKSMASILFVFLFTVASAGLWEIWEFTTDSLFNLTAQNGLGDTMWDIICGTTGGIIFCSIIYIHIKYRKIKLIEDISEIN